MTKPVLTTPATLPAIILAHWNTNNHHRGQIVMAARQRGHPLAPDINGGLWQWTKREKETSATPARRTA